MCTKKPTFLICQTIVWHKKTRLKKAGQDINKNLLKS